MAYDDSKLPRSVLRGENLYVGDDKEPFVRDPDYRLHLAVFDLAIAGGFEATDIGDARSDKQPSRISLSGRAKLDGKDNFAVAGLKTDPDLPIGFSLATVPATETRFVWRATIGFSRHDWELEIEETFYVHAYVLPEQFDQILAAVRTGHVESLRVAMETTMWTKRKSSGFMLGEPMTLYLVPPTDREDRHHAVEWANVASITWGESYGARRAPAVDADLPPSPTVIEFPARAYSLLTAIVGLLAALVMLVFLRR
jgi:hypothetical protein